MSDFVKQCIDGMALLDDIDDFVEAWHTKKPSRSLHQYLGMTKSEYTLWVSDPDVLPYIVQAHRLQRDVHDLLEELQPAQLAARSDSPRTALDLARWLKKEKLWD